MVPFPGQFEPERNWSQSTSYHFAKITIRTKRRIKRLQTERNFSEQWEEVPDNVTYENGFKIQWEDFIRHVVAGTPWKYDLVEGAKGVQLAELGLKSWAERRWLDVPALSI